MTGQGTEYGQVRRNRRDDGRYPQVPGLTVAQICKYILTLMIIAFIVLMMIFTGGSMKSFEEVAGVVEEKIDTDKLVKQDGQALKRYYGLNSADYENVMLYLSEFSISSEEVLMIKVKSEQQLQQVRDAVERRREQRIDAFSGYAPEQVQLLEDSRLIVRGKWLLFVVSSDADTYVSAFDRGL